jgi:hypothetical protein
VQRFAGLGIEIDPVALHLGERRIIQTDVAHVGSNGLNAAEANPLFDYPRVLYACHRGRLCAWSSGREIIGPPSRSIQYAITIIDAYALPVTHTTRRTGSPFTLVLAKTAALFQRDAAERKHWQQEWEWLNKTTAEF